MIHSPLVDASWLASQLRAGAVCVLDASWYQPTSGRDARADFEREHIPTARFFDLAQAADPRSDLSHTLPPPDHLAKCAAAVGTRRDELVVVYDNAGMSPSARAWWMLTAFGYSNVRVLNGGLRAWREAGLPLNQGASKPVIAVPEQLSSAPAAGMVADYEHVRKATEAGSLVLDARPAARFRGEAPEPVAGIRSGHIPGSINLHYEQLLDRSGALAPAGILRERFAREGVDFSAPVVCTCGSGVTACVLALALAELGHREVAVYDGSWTDWSKRTSKEEIA